MYEMVIHAGKDLDESIKLMLNEIVKQKVIPNEWNVMGILPIDKTGGWLEMLEKRGLFMTNILSKCTEKILFKRNLVQLYLTTSQTNNFFLKKIM